MKIFDNRVQEQKYNILREVGVQTWKGYDAFSVFNEIANNIVKKDAPPQSCCIYKDRAIVADRIRLALGGNKHNPNIVQVIDIACNECTEAGYIVTDLCRGCIAHSCIDTCKVNAINIDNKQHAHIDKIKCIECGRCAKACSFHAINNFQRPCEQVCKVKAISMGEGGEAKIDPEKCINCGACVYHCPFGATVDTSSLVDIIKTIIKSQRGGDFKIYAIVAPSISNQFLYAKKGQVITAIKKIGFNSVIEVAYGADMVASNEAEELLKKGFLVSSCCPAFVKYIETKFPNLADKISNSLSPMAELGKYIKEKDSTAKVVFIGPCVAKKAEVRKKEVSQYVDYAMTFEELQALIDSKNISLLELEETELNQATHFGRIFARTGGLTEALEHVLKEMNLSDFEFKPVICNGIEKCRTALAKADKDVLDGNFIEGMACIGGCVGGAGNLVHWEDAPEGVDKYGENLDATEILSDIKKVINIF